MNIKRYNIFPVNHQAGNEIENTDGRYVRFTDVAGLQQRLTAAEQRNARCESLLRQIIPCLAMSTNSTAPTYIRQINEALPKPTESGASE